MTSRATTTRLLGAFFAVLASLASTGVAAKTNSFAIAPLGTVLTVKSEGRAPQEVFSISNSGSDDLTLDVEVFAWSQDANGESVYEPTKDFLVYPKTLTLKKDQTRPVRLVRRSGLETPAKQTYYRIQFRELARSFVPSDSKDEVQVAIVTRVLIPLVVQKEGFNEEPVIQVRQVEKGLQISNPSGALLKMSKATCAGKDVLGLMYVHPGVTTLLPGKSCADKLTVTREGIGETLHDILPAR